MSRLSAFITLPEAIHYDGAVSLSNRTDYKNGTVHYSAAEYLVAVDPDRYEIFTGPDGQRMIRLKK